MLGENKICPDLHVSIFGVVDDFDGIGLFSKLLSVDHRFSMPFGCFSLLGFDSVVSLHRICFKMLGCFRFYLPNIIVNEVSDASFKHCFSAPPSNPNVIDQDEITTNVSTALTSCLHTVLTFKQRASSQHRALHSPSSSLGVHHSNRSQNDRPCSEEENSTTGKEPCLEI
jgi:hypothetical protein